MVNGLMASQARYQIYLIEHFLCDHVNISYCRRPVSRVM